MLSPSDGLFEVIFTAMTLGLFACLLGVLPASFFWRTEPLVNQIWELQTICFFAKIIYKHDEHRGFHCRGFPFANHLPEN